METPFDVLVEDSRAPEWLKQAGHEATINQIIPQVLHEIWDQQVTPSTLWQSWYLLLALLEMYQVATDFNDYPALKKELSVYPDLQGQVLEDALQLMETDVAGLYERGGLPSCLSQRLAAKEPFTIGKLYQEHPLVFFRPVIRLSS